MFDNPGEKIKNVSVVLFWISVVAFVILALVFATDQHGDFQPLIFCLLLIGGPLTSYVATLFLAAFGDLVEDTAHIRWATEEIKNGSSYQGFKNNPISSASSTSNGWKCTCGKVNAPYVTTCVCGKSKSEI